MIKKLIEEEKKFAEIEKEYLIETTYRSPQIDVDELIKNGYVSAVDYHNSHK
ncbi:MAG: hypothetical protein J6X21_05555 [Bacteroidaceae bacterium]|nr:hypothetical protein [Bacteroidaceae bacterium]